MGDDDVAVVRRLTLVQYWSEGVVLDGHHDAAVGGHPHLGARHPGDPAGPRPGRVDRVLGVERPVGAPVDGRRLDLAVLDGEPLQWRVRVDAGAVDLRVSGIGRDEARGLHFGVRHSEHPFNVR